MTQPVLIDGDRVWSRLEALAQIGATDGGGANREALAPDDTKARKQFLEWVAERGYAVSIDAIGNLFIRRPGKRDDLPPVAIGSHLDTQPYGGNYDGVYGVLAGLEVLETLDDLDVQTVKPVELVVWMNEEGSRFAPPTMGSSVFVGAVPLDEALNTQDASGVTVAQALADSNQALGSMTESSLGKLLSAFVEVHIEQGPVLEDAEKQVGVVTGVQGLRWFRVEVRGSEGHAGTTPRALRKDPLKAAARMVSQLHDASDDASTDLRFTVGRFDVRPGSPNTIPRQVDFTIDLRHPDEAVLRDFTAHIETICKGAGSPCDVTLHRLSEVPPTPFDPAVVNHVRDVAKARNIPSVDVISGATHDARQIASHCPTAMVFVPCKGGVSHSESESITYEDARCGAQVLLDTTMRLART